MNDIEKNLIQIKNRIREYEKRYHREPNSVSLLAASKNQPIEKISAALQAGQLVFGENYLQEALQKIAFFSNSEIIWHFIGSIQTNKTRKIAEHFSWVHTVSDKKIAQRLNDQRPFHLPPLNICLQINISEETSKSGMTKTEVLDLAKFCASLPRLKLRGLMAIPELKVDFNEQRAQLQQLKFIYTMLQENGLNLDTLSMGMSDDMEAAIAEGATLVRIGTAIFGYRHSNNIA